ncbi:diguanylate cyclase (GGDEF)-like protein [Paraburkholderia caballeronis]|uniref:GGDEF domain-containing protein n=1 Tax=Paraburkholderia caballeronis TaxID=416943 RepID=UPI0010E48182|nr:diguanylate cyclase [Paraburkholderia caballeronis]TDV34304.1 diguanylate cyclase (GGDEF)-like protein [Paraburkholderia caballeronis]
MNKRVLPPRHRARRWVTAKVLEIARMVGRHPFLAGITGTLTATVMAALTFQTLYAGRVEELDHAVENSRNVVTTISGDLARNVELYDLSLQAVVTGAQQPQTWRLPDALRQRVLFDRATVASFLGGAYVLDASGHVKASQTGTPNPALSLSARDYFVAQQRNPDAQLYISKPYRSMLRNGVLTVGLSRRINGADGRFDGVALLAVRIEYFQHLLDRIDVGRQGRVFVFLDDGTLLASKPTLSRGIGANYVDSPGFALMSRRASGTFTTSTKADGVERIYTYTHVANAPLIVGIAPAVDDLLANWRRRSRLAIGLTVVLGGAYVVLSWLFAFALRDKVLAEAELMRLAVTDPLTGLANRRALDRRLASEWQHAVHDETPLSVLFIDIDHFKRFNDTYGHAAGDEVLTVVAERIASALRRSVDTVARYGGEEFAVILPGTPAGSAARIAEKVRRRVEAANVAHSDSPQGRVTVSIGCATSLPPDGGSGARLLAAADRQLYEAKAAGRNQVRTQVVSGDSVEPPLAAGHGAAT